MAEWDIIKGICIIGIVFSHAGHALFWFSYFYLFGFYFVSGAVYRDKPFLKFAISKIRRMYIPFVFSNLLAKLMCFFLYKLNIYREYSWDGYIVSLLEFNLREGVMAPSWFLFPLFCISFLFYFMKRIIKNNISLFLITFWIMIIIVHYRKILSVYVWNNCAIILNLALGLFVYTCGYIYNHNCQIKGYIETSKYGFDFFIISLIILGEAKYYWNYHLDLRAGVISSGKWMIATYIAGICFLLYSSKIILIHSAFLKRILTYIGKNSMWIMLFHILCFNIVTIIGIYLLEEISVVPWSNALYGEWYYEYANILVGLTLPLLIKKLIEILKAKIYRWHSI